MLVYLNLSYVRWVTVAEASQMFLLPYWSLLSLGWFCRWITVIDLEAAFESETWASWLRQHSQTRTSVPLQEAMKSPCSSDCLPLWTRSFHKFSWGRFLHTVASGFLSCLALLCYFLRYGSLGWLSWTLSPAVVFLFVLWKHVPRVSDGGHNQKETG